MGFKPSKADPNVWMRRKGEQYEYVASYVDDLCGASHDVMVLMEEFKQHYSLKGVGSPVYYLGGDIVDLSKLWKNEGLVIGLSAATYIKRIVENFEREIGRGKEHWSFKKYRSPLPDGYHPEICDSPLLDPDRASFYRSMAGALQWIITIGRVDVAYAATCMSRFGALPKEGHL